MSVLADEAASGVLMTGDVGLVPVPDGLINGGMIGLYTAINPGHLPG